MNKFIKYYIQPQKDGSFVIIMKDKKKSELTIHSHHDTYEDARDELTDIHYKPSQTEVMNMIRDMKQQIK